MPEHRVNEPLAYDRSGSHYATRRQFRLLMALVLLNLLITLQFAYFPSLTASIKQRWAQYQQKREREAAVKQALALEQQAMKWSDAPGKVVWDENPDTAATLLAGGGYRPTAVRDMIPTLANWPRGAAAVAPPFARKLLDPRYVRGLDTSPVADTALVLLHGLESGSGDRRLVYVYVQGSIDLSHSGARRLGRAERGEHDPTTKPSTFSATKTLRLAAVTYAPGDGEKPPSPVGVMGDLLIHDPDGPGLPLKWHWTPPSGDKPEQIRIEGRETFRFYAGRPDPNDKSRFTIDYDVDGQRGTIRGQLKNGGTVELKPTTGTTIGTRWYPSGPSTQPAR